ncbi:MAG TPA: alpha/beta hydrolase [Pseudonocardia sp.]|jgi:pimeloyl-ACP methyl ester carboxylesterase|nr:alpha/beta hydrolase [Pseudonocardia sp.]
MVDPLRGLTSTVVTVNNGRRIHYVEAGSGPLVLLIHGFPESWYSWRHQLRVLADAGYRAVAVDTLGYGRSSKPFDFAEYRLVQLVEDYVGLVAALGETRAVAVGHDWGGPQAWAAAWLRPDIFRAVVGVTVPFAARGLVGFPGNPFGEIRPSVNKRDIAGADLLLYQEFCELPHVPEKEAEEDLRGWLLDVYFSLSGDAPQPEAFADRDMTQLSDAEIIQWLRSTGFTVVPGRPWRERFVSPEKLPGWLTDADLDFYAQEFERTGMTGAFNYYRCNELNWETLGTWQEKKIEVPSLFIGADKDCVTIWSRQAQLRQHEFLTNAHDPVIIENCGHWVQQERPEEFNAALLGFLRAIDS